MNNNITFDQAMKRLENIVNNLDKDNIELENAIDLFKEGLDLINICDNKLKSLETQVTSILNEGKWKEFNGGDKDELY